MDDTTLSPRGEGQPDLGVLVVALLKGVLYRDSDERQWDGLLELQARVRDYVGVLGLDLLVDEAEGYAFLRSRSVADAGTPVPRLIARRPLSFPVSLLLALLRKKLVESDALGGDTRIVLTRDEIIEMLRLFLPAGSNEARLVDQIEAHINKVIDLGFLRRLKSTEGETYELRRILKAFIDAQWLGDFEARLADYRAHVSGGANQEATSE
jgi:hypothetical protein